MSDHSSDDSQNLSDSDSASECLSASSYREPYSPEPPAKLRAALHVRNVSINLSHTHEKQHVAHQTCSALTDDADLVIYKNTVICCREKSCDTEAEESNQRFPLSRACLRQLQEQELCHFAALTANESEQPDVN
ncbi:hypothetical protein ABVT39_004857 [Epinephelus coioides]